MAFFFAALPLPFAIFLPNHHHHHNNNHNNEHHQPMDTTVLSLAFPLVAYALSTSSFARFLFILAIGCNPQRATAIYKMIPAPISLLISITLLTYTLAGISSAEDHAASSSPKVENPDLINQDETSLTSSYSVIIHLLLAFLAVTLGFFKQPLLERLKPLAEEFTDSYLIPTLAHPHSIIGQRLSLIIPSGAIPASKQMLLEMGKSKYAVTEQDLLAEQRPYLTCAVCLERMPLATRAQKLQCGHLFHWECVEPWLSKSCTCPTCRREIYTGDLLYELCRKIREYQRKHPSDDRDGNFERMTLHELLSEARRRGVYTGDVLEREDLVARMRGG